MVETMLREYPNVLTLRVRMPIVADLTYARNFIAKVRFCFLFIRFFGAAAAEERLALFGKAKNDGADQTNKNHTQSQKPTHNRSSSTTRSSTSPTR